MEFEIIKSSETKRSIWSGGTTSEIFIYPKNSSFVNRNFSFRFSIATVEVEESIFTSLPEINRTLMVLKGNLHLIHEGQHEIHLKEFDQDNFKGDWITKSKGKVTDFNLMTKGNCKGKLTHLFISGTNKIIDTPNQFELFYVVNGSVIIENNLLQKGDLIKFKELNQEIILNGDRVDVLQISVNLF